MNLAPLTTVLVVFAVTISVVHDSILFGLLPFILAAGNEVARMWALRAEAIEEQKRLETIERLENFEVDPL